MSNESQTSKQSANNLAILLTAICDLGVNAAGEAINKDASFISRLKSNDNKITLQEFTELLAASGLELRQIAEDRIVVDKKIYDALLSFANVGFHKLKNE